MAHNIVEKIVFSFGLIFLLSLTGYLSFLMYKSKSKPPELQVVSIYKPEMRNYAFEVEIRNTGEETATNAQIKLSLYQDGKAVESGTLNIDYVPVKSKETAWIAFKRKRKSTDSLVVSSLTYVKP